ncbi:hypothetical protein Esti_000350 [Eimeria stiedai]
MAEMISAAWKEISKCCTRRELGGKLNEQKQVPCAGREQIDEIAELLKLLSPSAAASDGTKKEPSLTSSISIEDSGFLEGLNRSEESTTTKAAGLSVQKRNGPGQSSIKLDVAGAPLDLEDESHRIPDSERLVCASLSQSSTKRDVAGAPVDLEGESHRISSSEMLVCSSSAQDEGNPSLASQEFPTEIVDHLRSDFCRNRMRWSCRVDKLSPSLDSSDDMEREEKELSHPRRLLTSIQLGHGSFTDGATVCSPGSRVIPNRSESSCAGDDSQHVDWDSQNKFSHVRMALAGGLTRAATLAFPAVQSLWVVSSPTNRSDCSRGPEEPNKALASWNPQFSLDCVRAAGWMAKGQRFRLCEPQQHAPPETVLDFPTAIGTLEQRADADATKDGADAHEAVLCSPPENAALSAVSETSASSKSHQAVTTGEKGSLAYFCLLGASIGYERSLSFKRRPLVTRPAGMPLHSVANLLGIVSLTGDSLGRKKHWCAILKTAAETGLATAQRIPGMPPHQKQLEHVLLLQLLQQQQGMVLPPSALNSTQQVGVCRARNLWIGAVVQGLGFEAPSAAEFVTGELLKELLHRCASSETPLWVQRLDAITAERHMLETFKAVAGQLQQQQPHLGGHGDETSSRHQNDRVPQASVTSAHAFQGLRRLREHRQLLKRQQLFLSGRASSAVGDGLPTLEKCKKPYGFDSLASGAVACQFLWDSAQQLLLVCHTGDVTAVLAHPARREKRETNPDHQVVQLTGEAAAAGKHHQHVHSSWSFHNSAAEEASCFLSSSYDCVVLTREHSTSDRDERRRIQGAGIVSSTQSARFPQEAARRTSSESSPLGQWRSLHSSEASREVWEDGPKFFCPCVLTPPLTATRSLGLCGGHQFGISTSPDIATVTIDPALGFCFLLVATSSLWKIFTPQEAVDLIVAELWRQHRQHFEQQSRRFLRPHGSNPLHTANGGESSQHTRQQMDDSSEHDVGKVRGQGRRGANFQGAQHSRKDHEGEWDFEDVESAMGNNVQPMQSINLQLAADVLENRFCEEWTLQRELEPLADLGLILFALKPGASP